MDEFTWLVELPGSTLMYLHPARGPGVCGFTFSPHEAERFPTKAAADEAIRSMGLANCYAAEHGFIG